MNQYKLDILDMANRFQKIRSANIYDVLDEMGYPFQTLNLDIKPPERRYEDCWSCFYCSGLQIPRKTG